jgi:hypothetical protein
MKTYTQKSLRRRNAFRGLLLAGFASLILRAIIPLGYMPGNILAGEFMVLCPSGLPAEVLRALQLTHHGHDKDVVDVDSSCPIGSALQPAWIPIDDAPLPFVIPATNDVAYYQPIAIRLIVRREYDSRAPPAV